VRFLPFRVMKRHAWRPAPPPGGRTNSKEKKVRELCDAEAYDDIGRTCSGPSIAEKRVPINCATRASARGCAGNGAIKKTTIAARNISVKVCQMHFEPEHPMRAPARVERRSRLPIRYDPPAHRYTLPREDAAIGAIGATHAGFLGKWLRECARRSCFNVLGLASRSQHHHSRLFCGRRYRRLR